MSQTVKLQVSDTGNHTANLVLLFNEWLSYAVLDAKLSPEGISRLLEVFRVDSRTTPADGSGS